MPWRLQGGPTKTERIVAGASYLTCGMAGLVFILCSKRDSQSTQFRFHAFQSIFLALLMMVVAGGITPFFSIIAQFVSLASHQVAYGLAVGVDFLCKGLYLVYACVIIYGAVMAFLGKFAEIPVISNIIHRNMPA